MLHAPVYLERIAERVGPADFSDPALRVIFQRLVDAAPAVDIEQLAAALDEEGNEVLQQLLADTGGLDAVERTVEDCLADLQRRQLQQEMKEIDGQVPLASGPEQDALIARKQQLNVELRMLRGRGWPVLQSDRRS